MIPSPSRAPISLATSPAGSGFLPRREFLQNSSRPSRSFSLLTLAGTSSLRFASFPDAVILAFRKYLDDRHLVRLFRENKDEELAEFTLVAKYWVNAKNVETEQLLLQLLVLLNSLGYTFLSSIDYGREPGDKLTLAFSRPVGTSLTIQQLVFAISFASATSLRVLSPPLSSTPGILAAVRSAWPRGVVSETKAADNVWEFKLKGYACM